MRIAHKVVVVLSLFMLVSCGQQEVKQVRDAYLFGYPLIMTDQTRATMNYPNALQHRRNFPDHRFRRVVRPNVDTLYSVAWFDLTHEPQVLEIPDSQGRYYLLPMLDAWSNVFASPGSRTTGHDAQKFLIAGPEWDGVPPEGMTILRAPTPMAWMIGRIDTQGPDDFTAVHTFQDKMSLTSLSLWRDGKTAIEGPPASLINRDVKQYVSDMPAADFFVQLKKLMAQNQGAVADQTFIDKKINPIFAGEIDNDTLEKGKKAAYKRLAFIHKLQNRKKGWRGIDADLPLGNYGTKYQLRAYIAQIGFGANEQIDALYPNTIKDADGDLLHSDKAYILHFDKDELPPVEAFWSITPYNVDDYLIENEINRFALGSHENMTYNEDGSLDIYIQKVPVEEALMANWLPVSQEGTFSITMRLYWPKEEALHGGWTPPLIEKNKS